MLPLSGEKHHNQVVSNLKISESAAYILPVIMLTNLKKLQLINTL